MIQRIQWNDMGRNLVLIMFSCICAPTKGHPMVFLKCPYKTRAVECQVLCSMWKCLPLSWCQVGCTFTRAVIDMPSKSEKDLNFVHLLLIIIQGPQSGSRLSLTCLYYMFLGRAKMNQNCANSSGGAC